MKRVVIEKAKLKNIPRIEEIFQECYVDEYKTQYPKSSKKFILNKIKDFKESIKGIRRILLVAKIDGKIIGFSQGSISKDDKSDGSLDKLFVLKKYRKKGIGKKLTKECLNWLKKKRVKEIEYYTLVKNIASIKNSEKQGFEKFCYIMRKKIK